MNKNNVAKALSLVLAHSYALAIKTQNYHWNVTGPQFKNLHELFGSQYEELSDAIDEVAERIRSLDVLVPASFDVFKNNSTIKDGNHKNSSTKMVEELYHGNQTLVKVINDALEICQKEGDEASADLMINRTQVHDKNAWMLKSSL